MKFVSPDPARHSMQVEMTGHARARRLAQVHAEVEPMRVIEPLQRLFGPLRQVHQLVGGLSGQGRQPVQMRVGHHHHVSRRVRIRIQADKAVLPAQHKSRGAFRLVRVHAVGNGVID